MVSSCFENTASASTGSQPSSCTQCQSRAENVLRMLSWRQISPDVRRPSRKFWGSSPYKCHGYLRESTSAKQALTSWLESESFKHSVANYCPLVPAPRSTIAAAFSPDGMTLASTHGDHTVKIICCRTGRCMKVLSGHRRTPWVVRFHPRNSEVLASGSLDYEVRLWNATTAACTGGRDFYRPIASLAFHAQGDILAVASGHKLYIWQYTKEDDNSNIILRTRRSLRAVHFHPLAAPLVLTAEVNDLDSPDCPMSVATSRGGSQTGLHYSHPWSVPVHQNAGWPWGSESEAGAPTEAAAPMDISPRPSTAAAVDEVLSDPAAAVSETGRRSPTVVGGFLDPLVLPEAATGLDNNAGLRVPLVPVARRHAAGEAEAGSGLFPLGLIPNLQPLPQLDTLHPFFQEWIQSGLLAEPARRGNRASVQNRPGLRPQIAGFADAAAAMAVSAAAAAGAELPCTVKLKLWPYDVNEPIKLLDPDKCKLTIPHAVLCSEMGTHFSPCGRFLAACVACVLPPEAEAAVPGRFNGTGGPGFSVQSPTQHPISTQQVIYELRIYSLEKATFGEVLVSKAVRAAHCLTSIQFSPTSDHILLAYGRRHSSLLRSIVLDGVTTIPVYTILEIYRVSDLKLVRVLPSAEDEVNVACFHPRVGGGLVYGTKEGKLRIIRQDWSSSSFKSAKPGLEDQLLEAETSDPLTFGNVPRNVE